MKSESFVSPVLSIELKMEGEDKACATLDAIKDRLNKVVPSVLENLAQRSSNSLRQTILAPPAAPLSPLSAKKRQIGKEQGMVWPPIPPYGPVPLHRSGALARAIDYAQEDAMRFVVGVAEGVVGEFSGGKPMPLANIAQMIESGFMRTTPLTLRMLVYLKVLYGEITRKPSRHLPNMYLGKTLTTWVPPRPVWAEVFDSFADKAGEFVADAVFDQLGLKAG